MGRRFFYAVIFILLFLSLAKITWAEKEHLEQPVHLLVKYNHLPKEIPGNDPLEEALSMIGVRRLRVFPGQDPEELIKRLHRDPNVSYVEFDHAEKMSNFVPDDPGFDSQHGLNMINIPKAWDIERGKDTVIVALLDTGVDLSHPDLKGRLVPGQNYINIEQEPVDDSVNSHGTGLAGIIASDVNNGIGISGATWGVKIMPMKVLDDQGRGFESDIAAAIIDATNRGAGIINLSFGSKNSSKVLEDAIRYALGYGVSVIAAAGNDGGPVNYPAAYDGVISVGAISVDKEVLPFSNRGEKLGLVAPGAGITSIKKLSLELSAYHGSSAAAAFVTGVAALIKSNKPVISPGELRDVLYSTATDINQPGFDISSGYGLVNTWGALAAISSGKGEIAGKVELGNIGLPGVPVVIVGTGKSTKTNIGGNFLFEGLPPGNYEVSVFLSGYPSQQKLATVGKEGGSAVLIEPFTFNKVSDINLNGLPLLSLSPAMVGYAAPLEFNIESRQLVPSAEDMQFLASFFAGSATPHDAQWLKNPVIVQGVPLKEALNYLSSRGEYTLKTAAPLADGEYYVVISRADQELSDGHILGWFQFRVSRQSVSPAMITRASQLAAGKDGVVLVNNGAEITFRDAIQSLMPEEIVAFSFDPLSTEYAKEFFKDLQQGWHRAGKTWFIAGVLADGNRNAVQLILEKPVLISLPVDSNNFSNKDTIGLYWWNGSGWTYLHSHYDPSTGTMKGSTDKTGIFTVMAYTPAFTDMRGSWALHEIEILASRQVIKGITSTMFAPERTITRGQLAALLTRALDVKTEKPDKISSARFKDVNTNYWGYSEIESASAAGLVNGYSDGSFHPNQPVAREELAVMLVRALNYLGSSNPEDSSILGRFTDGEKVSPGLAGQVGAAIKLGIVRGKGNGYLQPKSTATRAEAAVMLYRMLDIGGLI